MLLHMDIMSDKNHWSNESITRYFYKESVILREKTKLFPF